ncbi:MAG: hypothetical protein ACRDOD_17165 [Streptosporangiaceae bacterium]
MIVRTRVPGRATNLCRRRQTL